MKLTGEVKNREARVTWWAEQDPDGEQGILTVGVTILDEDGEPSESDGCEFVVADSEIRDWPWLLNGPTYHYLDADCRDLVQQDIAAAVAKERAEASPKIVDLFEALKRALEGNR
jgi:hypothetical protein